LHVLWSILLHKMRIKAVRVYNYNNKCCVARS
jgi:hypothetical protein